MRFFNTTGPVVPADHYCIRPLERLNLDEVLTLVRDKRYFVLHAPRQTGKTSALLALRELLNGGSEGGYRCVYANVEGAQAMREDVAEAMRRAVWRWRSCWRLSRRFSGSTRSTRAADLPGAFRDRRPGRFGTNANPWQHQPTSATSNSVRLRASRLNSTAIRWMGCPVPR